MNQRKKTDTERTRTAVQRDAHKMDQPNRTRYGIAEHGTTFDRHDSAKTNEPAQSNPLIWMHRTHGNQALQRLGTNRDPTGTAVTPAPDGYERGAERVAQQLTGRTELSTESPAIQPSSIGGGPGAVIQRQESGGSGSQRAEYAEAAKKTGEAFLATELGKAIQDRLKQLGLSFLGTLAGKVFTGTAAAGAVTALVATNEELPVQPPEIPLDSLAPGLSVKLTYEGPVRNPTKAFVQFTYRFGAGAPPSPQPSTRERRESETEWLRRELHQFRESLKTPEQRAAEERIFREMFMQRHRRSPFNPLNIPGLQPVQGGTAQE